MEMIRAFVAIELDDALKTVLRQVQARFKRDSLAQIGRWVAPDGIHLTLQFLGDVSPGRVDEITQALERACRPFAPFPLSLTQPGFFPNARKLRVVWVGVYSEADALLVLQRAVESALNGVGFPPEKRGFQPHLTLARIRDQASTFEREEMAKLIGKVKVDESVSMLARQVCLIRSDLQPGGAVYTQLAAVPLLGS